MEQLGRLRRPPLPGEGGSGEPRVALKRRLLACVGLPSTDEWDVREFALDRILDALAIWLASDNELYFLQRLPHTEDRDWWRDVPTSYNRRKALSWLRSELCTHLRAAGATHEDTVVGWYRFPRQETRDSELEQLLSTWLAAVEQAYDDFLEEHGREDAQVAGTEASMDHCLAQGVKLNKLETVVDPRYGRCLRAAEDIPAGEALISLPEECVVNVYAALYDSHREGSRSLEPTCDGLRCSESFVWAVLLGGRYADGTSLIGDELLARSPMLREFLDAHTYPRFFMQEQLFLVLFLAYEAAVKGPASKWYPWLSHLSGYADCQVADGYENLLVTKYPEVVQFLDDERITQSITDVNDCLERLHAWARKMLTEMFPEVFEDVFEAKVTVARLRWACWICESREFESPMEVPMVFLKHVDADKRDGVLQQYLAPDPPECEASQPLTESDLAVPKLNLVTDLLFMTEEAFAGPDQVRRPVDLPICLGWSVADGQPIVRTVRFSLRRRCLALMPVIDYLNHSELAQCAHPGFHDLESRLTTCNLTWPWPRDIDMPLLPNSSAALATSRQVVVRTNANLRAGEQVLINYGPHEAWSFLRYYGFYVPDPTESILVEFDFDSAGPEKAALLREFKLPPEHVVVSGGRFDLLLSVARVFVLEDVAAFRACEERRRYLFSAPGELSAENCGGFDAAENDEAALEWLLQTLTGNEDYLRVCAKLAEALDLSLAPPPWYKVWGAAVEAMLFHRKMMVEELTAQVYVALSGA